MVSFKWSEIITEVPQGPLLGSVLLNREIKEPKKGWMTGKEAKFSDDTKLFRTVKQNLTHSISQAHPSID